MKNQGTEQEDVIALSGVDLVMIQHALGCYARVKGFRRNPALDPTMNALRLKIDRALAAATAVPAQVVDRIRAAARAPRLS